MPMPPILLNKHYTEPSVFTVENLLREARRQKGVGRANIPRICVLDPDGDIVRWLVAHGYSDADIGKCVGGNVMRVLEEVWWRQRY